MAPSAAIDDDDLSLLVLLLGHHFVVLASLLYAADHRLFFSTEQRRRCLRRIPRCALVHMDNSSFRALYNSRNDQSFITFTGLDYNSFQYLLNKFRPLYNRYSPYVENGKVARVRHEGGTHGRPRSLDAASCLGLVLGYTRTRGGLYAL